jgi:hypothetical protein
MDNYDILMHQLRSKGESQIWDLVEELGIRFRRSKHTIASRVLAILVSSSMYSTDLRWFAYVNLLDVRSVPVSEFPLLENFSVATHVDFDLLADCVAIGSNFDAVHLVNSIFEDL